MSKQEYRVWHRMRRILRSFEGTSLGLMCGSDPKASAWRMAWAAEKTS